MQIGKGKQGVIVAEYGDNGSGFLGYIEPACDKNQWILWFDSKGDAVLYTERETGLEPQYHEADCSWRKAEESKKEYAGTYPCTCGLPHPGPGGVVVGEPIRLKAKGRTRRVSGAPQASITGNMEIGRATIRGEEYLTLKVDKKGGTLKHLWPDGDASDIVFGKEGDGHDYDGRDPEQCVNLVGRTQTIILVNRVDRPEK
jgi:hypothetical protein